jgi:DNA topoisomerase VI subunit B
LTKELIDNSLETTQDASITIKAYGNDCNNSLERILFTDNGNGIDEDGIRRVFEQIECFSSSKRHYKTITRGSQGNALKTVIGIQYLLGNPLIVRSQNKEYSISIIEDVLTNSLVSDIKTKDIDFKGFEVELNGNFYHYGNLESIYFSVLKFIVLNPQASFQFYFNDRPFISSEKTGNKVNVLDMGTATTGFANWFDYNSFSGRLKADILYDPNMTVRNFVGEFLGLTSNQKVKTVMKSIPQKHIKEFVFDKRLDEEKVRCLHASMKDNTVLLKDTSKLGNIGRDNLYEGLIWAINQRGGLEEIKTIKDKLQEKKLDTDIVVYYSKGDTFYGDKITQFYFELIAIPTNWEKSDRAQCDLTFGINQSLTYTTPKFDILVGKNNKHYSSIESVFNSFEYDFKVVCNLFCPNIDFKDKGKQAFNMMPFEKAISEVVNKSYEKIKKEVVRSLNKLNDKEQDRENDFQLEGKAPIGYIKNFVFDNFWKVYNEASDNGRLTVTLRNFYYAFRAEILRDCEDKGYIYTSSSTPEMPVKINNSEKGFKYKTFTGYVDDFEVNVIKKRLIYKNDRGFAIEPHTGRRIDLGTASINRYDPDLEGYNNILFIEKAGFYELIHEDLKLTKKYDILLVNSSGFATNAVKDLVQKIQVKNPNVRLFSLTDLDIKGLGIAKNIEKADELSAIDIFECEIMGIKVEDIEKYNLLPEPVEYSNSLLKELKNRYDNGELTKETYDFLMSGQRLEINAISPSQFGKYLEDKFKEFGIKKVIPDIKKIEIPKTYNKETSRIEALQEAVGKWVLDYCENDLFDFLDGEIPVDREIKFDTESEKKKMHQDIIVELDKFPVESWKEINTNKVNSIMLQQDKARGEYKDDLIKKALDILEKNVSIDFTIDSIA